MEDILKRMHTVWEFPVRRGGEAKDGQTAVEEDSQAATDVVLAEARRVLRKLERADEEALAD